MRKKIIISALLGATILTSGCATQGLGSGDFTRSQVRRVVSTQPATVVSIRHVHIDGEASAGAQSVGSIAGGTLGATLGGHKSASTRLIGGTVGAFLGYTAANLAGAAGSSAKGVELTIETETQSNTGAFGPGTGPLRTVKKLITIQQQLTPGEDFQLGENVFLTIDQAGVSRVIKRSNS